MILFAHSHPPSLAGYNPLQKITLNSPRRLQKLIVKHLFGEEKKSVLKYLFW